MFSKEWKASMEQLFQERVKELPELKKEIEDKFFYWERGQKEKEKRIEKKTEEGTEKRTEEGTEKGTEEGTEKREEKGIEEGTRKGTEGGIEKEIENTLAAMKYLYATMPISDMMNYSFEDFMDFARNGVLLMEESPFVSGYSEDIFLKYVLYHRVNEEEIAPCRKLFHKELKEWVHSGNIKEAALEVNYWCAKEASYQSTDDRTMSALAVYRSGSGRCGEESVFAVNAFRSIGIPARQIYAPRWSHCDDNHAWVEVFLEGGWKFLGACEPEEVLNRGWFTGASSRAMMVHSKSFSGLSSEGEEVGRKGMVVLESQARRYAAVKRVRVLVKNEAKKALSGVMVEFQVLNYSEFAFIASGVTDEEGCVALSLGLGSVLISASYDKKAARCLLDVENNTLAAVFCGEGRIKSDSIELTLKDPSQTEGWTDFDMTAPKDAPLYKIQLEDEVKKEGRRKFSLVTAQRLKKIDGLRNSEIEKFLEGRETEEEKEGKKDGEKKADSRELKIREKLLESLSGKDKRDCKADILEDHLKGALPYQECYPEEIFVPYVLCPRIKNEPLTKYRSFIRNYFLAKKQEDFKKNPVSIWEYLCQEIREKAALDYEELTVTPAACLKYKTGGELSRKLLFTAIARTLGIPARLNPLDDSPEYFKDDHFEAVTGKSKGKGKIIFRSGDSRVSWTYFQNWSVARLEEGRYQSLLLGGFSWEDKEELSAKGESPIKEELLAKGEFPIKEELLVKGESPIKEELLVKGELPVKEEFLVKGELPVKEELPVKREFSVVAEQGQYRVITSNRLPNGNIFAKTCTFSLEEGEEKEITLLLREARLQDMLENISLFPFTLRDGAEEKISAEEITSQGKTLFMFLEEGKEPTEHILNEILERKEEFSRYEYRLVFILRNQEARKDPTLAKCLAALPGIQVYYDDFAVTSELARKMYVDPEKLPLLVVTDKGLKGIYASSGYNVGTADLLLRIFK